MVALASAHHAGDLAFDPQRDDKTWREQQRQLYQYEWVVYAKTSLDSPHQVQEYLSRYTHRMANGNERALFGMDRLHGARRWGWRCANTAPTAARGIRSETSAASGCHFHPSLGWHPSLSHQ